MRVLTRLARALPSRRNPQSPPLNTITLGVRSQPMNLQGRGVLIGPMVGTLNGRMNGGPGERASERVNGEGTLKLGHTGPGWQGRGWNGDHFPAPGWGISRASLREGPPLGVF